MKLNSLYLRDFRNYVESVITFSPKLNYIYGENAQGKTNLLEAIHLFITGRSFRSPHLMDLIRFGSDSFVLEAHFEKNGIEQTLQFAFSKEGRILFHNATSLPSLSTLLGILNGVIISPEDHALVKGGPAYRRQFLDLQIACENPLYLYHLGRYSKAMRQRNSLLKSNQLKTIEIWEEQMAESAAFLVLKREETINQLKNEKAFHHQIDALSLSYLSQAPLTQNPENIQEYFLKQFHKMRPRETRQGHTLVGPHRDDLQITIGGHDARQFASEGQTRSCVAVLRLAQWSRLRRITGESPLLCIDDIGISLDCKRENQLYKQLNSVGQVFITSPRNNKDLPSQTRLICIQNGSFSLQENDNSSQ